MNLAPTTLEIEDQVVKQDMAVSLSEFELELIAGGTGIVNTI